MLNLNNLYYIICAYKMLGTILRNDVYFGLNVYNCDDTTMMTGHNVYPASPFAGVDIHDVVCWSSFPRWLHEEKPINSSILFEHYWPWF